MYGDIPMLSPEALRNGFLSQKCCGRYIDKLLAGLNCALSVRGTKVYAFSARVYLDPALGYHSQATTWDPSREDVADFNTVIFTPLNESFMFGTGRLESCIPNGGRHDCWSYHMAHLEFIFKLRRQL